MDLDRMIDEAMGHRISSALCADHLNHLRRIIDNMETIKKNEEDEQERQILTDVISAMETGMDILYNLCCNCAPAFLGDFPHLNGEQAPRWGEPIEPRTEAIS
jgi:hypothetical protein